MIIIGDAKTELAKLESETAQCVITSPPYRGDEIDNVAVCL